MLNLKSRFRSVNQFLKDYAFVLLLLLGGGLWLSGGTTNVYPEVMRSQSVSSFSGYSEKAMDMAMSDEAEPMFARSKQMIANSIMPPQAQAQGFDPDGLDDRKIIKNGSLQLEVENTEESLGLVSAELKAQKAYITHQNSWEIRRGTLAYNLTIRVPAGSLETLSKNLEKLGLKKSENYSTSDVTSQYRDTANRIKNLEVRRERLRELMGRETENVSDVLEIDRELSRVQTDIDNYTSTQKRRDTDVTYSSLQLTLNPEPEIGDFSSPDWNLESSWKTAVNDFFFDAREIVNKIIRVVVYTPIWLPILLIFWGLKRWMFGGKKKKTKK